MCVHHKKLLSAAEIYSEGLSHDQIHDFFFCLFKNKKVFIGIDSAVILPFHLINWWNLWCCKLQVIEVSLKGTEKVELSQKKLICSPNSSSRQSWGWETIVQSCGFHYSPVKITEGMSSPILNCLPRDRRSAKTQRPRAEKLTACKQKVTSSYPTTKTKLLLISRKRQWE